MSESSYGQTGTPRVFIDLIQWAKLQGRVRRYSKNASHFDYDPTTTNIDTSFTTSNAWTSYVYFDNTKYRENLQFRHLLQSFNYAGMLGHSLAETPNAHNIATFHIGFSGRGANNENAVVTGNTYNNKIHVSGAFGRNIGCSLYTFDGFSLAYGQWEDAWEEMRVVIGNSWANPAVDFIKFGTITAGRYFDFPQNVDLKLNKTFDFDQAQTKRTYGGTDLTQINYKRQLWNGLPPWTHINLDHHEDYASAIRDENYKDVAFQGKRSWDLSMSYVSKEEMFPMNYSNSMIGYYGNIDEELGGNLINNGTMAETGGTEGTTSGSSNVALNWKSSYTTNVTESIVTGNGFNGNAQKLIITADDTTFHFRYNLTPEMKEGTQYKVTFNYRSNSDPSSADIKVRVGYGNFSNDDAIYLATNTGDAVRATYYFTPTSQSDESSFPTYVSFYAFQRDTGTYLEVSDIEVREVIIPTGTWFDVDDGVHTENIIGSLMTFTHGGNIPFIFQPDNTIKSNFAMCIIDQKSINVKRVAPDLYNIKLKIREI